MPSTRRRRREGKVITTSTRRPRDCSANVTRGRGPHRGCTARFEVCIFPSGARRCTKLAKTRVVVACVASSSTSSFERQRTAINRRSPSKWSVVPASLIVLWERGGLVLRRRRADASAAAVAAVTRAVQHGATTDASELCAPLGPSSAARADASPRIAPCARGFYRFVDGDERAFAGDCILRAARPTSPQRSPASQAASWQYAGIARGSCLRRETSSRSDTSVLPRRFRSNADVISSCD